MNKQFHRVLIFTFLSLFILLGVKVRAQSIGQEGNFFLFDDDDQLRMSLTSDFSELIKNKEDENYYPGECVIYWTKQDSLKVPLTLKARGYFRKINCFFPPLMLNFKPDSLRTADGIFGKIKLVTHCQKSKIYKTYILEEYLIYKLYAILSPYHFRTRLVDINYWDTGKRERHNNNIGFLIEPLESVCMRNDCIEIKTAYFSESEVNALEADRVALFMYMIGNTDWRIKGGHNVKFIKPLSHKIHQVIPVPYDFDHAGFINTNYANPSEWTIAETVTQRDFLGKCRISDATYDQLIPEFLEKKKEIMKTIREFKWIEHKSRKRLIKYIEGFYNELEKPERFKRHLHNSCMDKY